MTVTQFIRDKRGRKLRVTVEKNGRLADFSLDDDSERIGKAYCLDEGCGRWRLQDIEIYEDRELLERANLKQSLGSWLRNLFGLGPKFRSNRRHGLGGALLKVIIAHARHHGAKHIRGSVVQDDLQERPWLIPFYEKHGFKRVTHEPGDISDVVVRIDL